MFKSSSCGYSDAYILVKRTVTATRVGAKDAAKRLNERNKGVIIKNCVPITDCIQEIKNTQVDNAKDKGFAMPMYSLTEYSYHYSKPSGSLWQYCRDEPTDVIVNSELFKSKTKITGKPSANSNTKGVEMTIPLKYSCTFWRILKMPLINCKVNLILTLSVDCVISSATAETKGATKDTKLYVPFKALSTQDNVKLLQK